MISGCFEIHFPDCQGDMSGNLPLAISWLQHFGSYLYRVSIGAFANLKLLGGQHLGSGYGYLVFLYFSHVCCVVPLIRVLPGKVMLNWSRRQRWVIS